MGSIRIILFISLMSIGIYVFAAIDNFNSLIAEVSAEQKSTSDIIREKMKTDSFRRKQKTLESLKSKRRIYALEGSNLIIYN